jgi:hypothetical protein
MRTVLRNIVYKTQWMPRFIGVPLRRAARKRYHSAPGTLRPLLSE